jgi:alpha-ribazole phosphatase
LPINSEEAFKELGSGDWEGISFKVAQELYPKEFKEWASKQPGTKAPNGETWENLQERAVTTLSQIVEQNNNKTIFISAHGGGIKALQCYFLDKKLTEMDDLPWVSNASISEVHYDNGKYEIIEVGKDDYLQGLTTQFTDAL